MKIWHIKTIVATVTAVILFVLLMIIILWQQGIIKPTTDNKDLSQFLGLTEDEFLNIFHLPEIDDPQEKMKRVKALKEHQQAVLENNKAYQAGERTWFEGINEFSIIPDDEFIATHTGLIEDTERLNETQPVLEESVMSNLPASYDSVSLGHVSPVKNQGGCGSSVAFATLALVETCFKCFQHGAVLVAAAVNANFSRYRGGIFGGCYESDKVNQAVVVVGYGSENGLDYWLVKNSWGPGWGDQGYIKIMRGVNMCGIGTTMVTLSCEAVEEENNPGTVRPRPAIISIV